MKLYGGLRWYFSVPVDEPIVLPHVEARDERWDVHLVRSLNGLGVRRALDVFNAADVVPVIDKMHPVYHRASAFERLDQVITPARGAGAGKVLWFHVRGSGAGPPEGAEGGRPRM